MRSIFKSRQAADIVLFSIVVLIALGLKHHYSVASPDDLVWILGPAARVVETLTGIEFVREAGSGYISRETMTIIAPSCAGVNFLIMAFTMCNYVLIPKAACVRTKISVPFLCAAVSYTAALSVNSIRIIGAVYLYRMDLSVISATPEQLHRFEGVAIYFAALWGLYAIVKRGFKTPFIWYIAVALGVPLLNTLRNGFQEGFVEHAVFVITVPLFMVILVAGLKTVLAKWRLRPFKREGLRNEISVETLRNMSG